jgi:hypothetical protein
MSNKVKKLYSWNWEVLDDCWPNGQPKVEGYNQCGAYNKAEARKIGNAMSPGKLRVQESSLRLVKDVASFWANYPSFD